VNVRLVSIVGPVMEALADDDVARASAAFGSELPAWFGSGECARVWRRRVVQIAEDPSSARWVAHLAVDADSGIPVGHAGFHGPPDESGMVEMGYSVRPDLRRRGYARAIVRAMLAWGRAEPDARVLRASISPDNVASLATIAGFGFEQVGDQWDDEDGLELLFERQLSPAPS
jgi:RimJ/RimL family protein N-acetyltransferase